MGSVDLNKDGKTDLLWHNRTTGDVTVWYMDHSLWTGQWDYLGRGVPTQWKIVAITDLDGDGKTDLVWQNSQTGDVTYWRMDGITYLGYGYIAQGVPVAWKIVGSADLNNDGKRDLLWQNNTTGDVTVWFMNGTAWTGNWSFIAQGVPTAWRIAAIMDTDHDNKADLIWQNNTTGDVTVWFMDGAAWTGEWGYIAHNVPTDWKIVPTH